VDVHEHPEDGCTTISKQTVRGLLRFTSVGATSLSHGTHVPGSGRGATVTRPCEGEGAEAVR